MAWLKKIQGFFRRKETQSLEAAVMYFFAQIKYSHFQLYTQSPTSEIFSAILKYWSHNYKMLIKITNGQK